MSWLLLILLAWKPIWWSGVAIYHKLSGHTWDSTEYLAHVKQWGMNLWGLVKPGDL